MASTIWFSLDEFLHGEHKSKSVTSLVFDTMVPLSACHSWQVWIGIVADDMTTLDTIAIYNFFAKHLADFLFYTHIFVEINIDVILVGFLPLWWSNNFSVPSTGLWWSDMSKRDFTVIQIFIVLPFLHLSHSYIMKFIYLI